MSKRVFRERTAAAPLPNAAPALKAKAQPPPAKKPRAKPPMAVPSVDFIRICRWLENGSSVSNCRKMAKALKLKAEGGKQDLIAMIVEHLESKTLPLTFFPTISDVALSDDAFNEKWQATPVYKIDEICAMLVSLE